MDIASEPPVTTDVNTTYATSTAKTTIILDSAQFDSATYYFEVVVTNTSGSTRTVYLTNSNGTNVASCAVTTGSYAKRVRSSSFSPNASYTSHRVTVDATGTFTIYAAKVIVVQDCPTKTVSVYPMQPVQNNANTKATAYSTTSNVTAQYRKQWKYVASEWNPTPTFYFEAVVKNDGSSRTAYACIHPTGSSTATAEVSNAGTTVTYKRSSSFTPSDGTVYELDLKSSSASYSAYVYNARIVAVQSGNITNTVCYFRISRLSESGAAGFTSNRVLYTASNWSSATTITHIAVGYESATDADNDVEIGHFTTNDSGLTGYTSASTGYVNFNSTTTVWKESSSVSLTDTYRYAAGGLEADSYTYSLLTFKPSAPLNYTKTYTADALIKKLAIAKTYSGDARIKAILEKSFTADAVIASGITTVEKAYTADANIKLITEKAFTADSLIKKLSAEKAFTADALIKALSEEKSYTSDALIKRLSIEKAFTGDALLEKEFTKAHTADTLFKKQGIEKSHTGDALLRDTFEKAHTADARLRITIEKSLTADALIKGTEALAYTSDAIIRRIVSKDYSADALIKKLAQEKAHTADTLLKKLSIEKSYTADSRIKLETEKSFTADALIKGIEELAYTADAMIATPPVQKGYTADALIKKASIELSLTVDALLRGTEELNHTADALLRDTFSKDYSADALLRKTAGLTYNADALIKGTSSLTYTADLLIKKGSSLTHTADAELVLRPSKTYTGDAYIGAFIGEMGNAIAVSRTLRAVATVSSLRSSSSPSTLRASGQASTLRANAISSPHKVKAEKEVLG